MIINQWMEWGTLCSDNLIYALVPGFNFHNQYFISSLVLQYPSISYHNLWMYWAFSSPFVRKNLRKHIYLLG